MLLASITVLGVLPVLDNYAYLIFTGVATRSTLRLRAEQLPRLATTKYTHLLRRVRLLLLATGMRLDRTLANTSLWLVVVVAGVTVEAAAELEAIALAFQVSLPVAGLPQNPLLPFPLLRTL